MKIRQLGDHFLADTRTDRWT